MLHLFNSFQDFLSVYVCYTYVYMCYFEFFQPITFYWFPQQLMS